MHPKKTQPNHKAVSTVLLEKIMDLEPEEPIPEHIVKSFHLQHPEKSFSQLDAYLKGYRAGLEPRTHRRRTLCL